VRQQISLDVELSPASSKLKLEVVKGKARLVRPHAAMPGLLHSPLEVLFDKVLFTNVSLLHLTLL